jgi:ribokinase
VSEPAGPSGRVVVVGSYNVGLTVVAPTLPIAGQTVLGHTFDMGPGGKGSNQAIGAKRLGADVTLVTKIGNDVFAQAALELFEQEGLSGPGILRADTHTGVGLILVDDSGSNMIAVAPGANALLSAQDVAQIEGLFDGAAFLLCQLECPAALLVAAAVSARRAGARTVLNPAPAAPLPEAAYGLCHVMTPNQTELAALTGMSTDTEELAAAAARSLLARGVGEVVVTLGERGAMRVQASGTDVIPARAVNAVDSTGAGDAFNAGLVAALAEGRSMDEAIVLGSRAGAFCVTRLGVIDGLPSREQLDAEVPP